MPSISLKERKITSIIIFHFHSWWEKFLKVWRGLKSGFMDCVINEVELKNIKLLQTNTLKIDYFPHYFQQFNLHPVESSLAKNKFYRAIFKSIGSILLIVPVVLMMVLCCRLSVHLYRAQKEPSLSEGPGKVSYHYFRSKLISTQTPIIIWIWIFPYPTRFFCSPEINFPSWMEKFFSSHTHCTPHKQSFCRNKGKNVTFKNNFIVTFSIFAFSLKPEFSFSIFYWLFPSLFPTRLVWMRKEVSMISKCHVAHECERTLGMENRKRSNLTAKHRLI